jgi:ornithine cyclodeaminase/alanine dehydrogenase-like protein (mu-crystallin family)
MSAADRRADMPLRYLSRADVMTACAEIDAVRVVRDVLELHAEGRTTLPEEAYLGWQTSAGTPARCLALPGALWGQEPALGLKIINASTANPDRGIPRAQGLTLLFDRETARPTALMEAAYISALRTAAYTALSVELLAARAENIAIIGCGTLGECHARLLSERLPQGRFLLHDLDPRRRHALQSRLRNRCVQAEGAPTAQSAIGQSDVVVTTTTTTTGYVEFGWLLAGALIAHVSLDDVKPEVAERADLLIVDDWNLVKNDSRRLLGRMYRAGHIADPAGTTTEPITGRRVDATLGSVLTGRHPGRSNSRQIILSNPFGMGILDVAIAAEVFRAASRLELGLTLPV